MFKHEKFIADWTQSKILLSESIASVQILGVIVSLIGAIIIQFAKDI